MHWVSKANCKNLTHIFFSQDKEFPVAAIRREALAHSICSECKVFNECRDYARSNGEVGYWAGENEFDRHLLGFQIKNPYAAFSRALRTYSKRKNMYYNK